MMSHGRVWRSQRQWQNHDAARNADVDAALQFVRLSEIGPRDASPPGAPFLPCKQVAWLDLLGRRIKLIMGVTEREALQQSAGRIVGWMVAGI
jgi:hypothetical protein